MHNYPIARTQEEEAEICYRRAKENEKKNNPIQAIENYKKAVALDHVQAMYDLAGIYLLGKLETETNAQNSYNLYRRAASKGHILAKIHLAILQTAGMGTKKNLAKAYMNFSSLNIPEAQKMKNILKEEAISYLKKGLEYWNLVEMNGINRNPNALSYACQFLMQVKKRAKNVEELKNEYNTADKELIKIIPQYIKLLELLCGTTSKIYVKVHDLANGIRYYDDSHYKAAKDDLEGLRISLWKKLDTKEKEEVKIELAQQNHIQTDSKQAKRDLDNHLYQALREKCALGILDKVKQLLEGGAEVNAVDNMGRNAAHYAVMRSHLVDVIAKKNHYNIPVEECMKNHLAVLELLCKKGVDFRAKNANGNSVLDLLERDIKGGEGITPLDQEIASKLKAKLKEEIEPRQNYYKCAYNYLAQKMKDLIDTYYCTNG